MVTISAALHVTCSKPGRNEGPLKMPLTLNRISRLLKQTASKKWVLSHEPQARRGKGHQPAWAFVSWRKISACWPTLQDETEVQTGPTKGGWEQTLARTFQMHICFNFALTSRPGIWTWGLHWVRLNVATLITSSFFFLLLKF